MSEIEKIKQHLKDLELAYQPGPAAIKAISGVMLVNIIGPSGVGKSSINHQVTMLDKDFSVPLGFTTRAPRPDEKLKQYRHIPDTVSGWKSILDKAELGELVQFAIHATSGMIYGTEPQDYKTRYSVLDMQFQFVEKSHELGFKAVQDLAIVTTADDYRRQLDNQRTLIGSGAEMEKRRREGILCLQWCLEHGDRIGWVHNRYGQLEQTARDVISLVKGDSKTNPGNRQLGQELLEALKSLKPAA